MGMYLVNAVLNGLKACEPSLPWKNDKIKVFGANEVAFLAVIANGQPNPGARGQTDTICYGSPESLGKMMHLKKSCFHDTRNFLVRLGLIDFRTSDTPEGETPFDNPEDRRTNVYRIGMKAVRELCGADSATWQHKILRVTDGDLEKLTAGQRRILCLEKAETVVRNTDTQVRNTDSQVRNTDSRVRNTDTNIYKNKTKQKNNTIPDTFVGGALDELVGAVADACQAEEYVVKRNVLQAVVRGKDVAAVRKIVSEFSDECYREGYKRSKTPEKRVGLLVSRLKSAPAATAPTREELKAFVPMAPKNKRNVVAETIESTWKTLVENYRLDESPAGELNDLHATYTVKFNRIGLEHLDIFVSDLRWYDGVDEHSPDAVCRALPGAMDRKAHFLKRLGEREPHRFW